MGTTNKIIDGKIDLLAKGIEVLGGKEFIDSYNSQDKLKEYIISSLFNTGEVIFEIDGEKYTIPQIIEEKLNYEKSILKGKVKTIEGIVYKIKKYDSSLDSLIRKFKKSKSIEEYNKMFSEIEGRYRRDINKLILNKIEIEKVESLTREEEELYYGVYLSQKKKGIIDAIVSKMGIN